MLNYIVYWVVMYLIHGVAADPDYPNATLYLEDAMRLPFLNEDIELSSNLIIALVVALLSGLFLFKTKWGYALRMTGDNPTFAVYSGIKAKSYVTSSQVIGAGLAGMGGAAFLLGNYYRFQWASLPNYGFDGFVIASIAGNNPYAVPLAALFLGGLWGGMAGAVGMTIADLTTAYVTSAPKTFLLKLCIGLITGFVAHKIFKISQEKENRKVPLTAATAISCAAGMGFNIIADPLVGYFYKMYILGVPQEAASIWAKIGAMTTSVNAVVAVVAATVLYMALRRAMKRSNLMPKI